MKRFCKQLDVEELQEKIVTDKHVGERYKEMKGHRKFKEINDTQLTAMLYPYEKSNSREIPLISF